MPALIVLDTETTGLTQPIGVVEFAHLRVNEQLEVLDEHSVLVNPGRPIEPGAQEIHGITDLDVGNAISIEQAVAPIADEEIIAIGHNVQFDLNLVERYLNVAGKLCTLALARQHVPSSPRHKLTTVTEHLGLPLLEAHRALGDCHMALNLLRHIVLNSGIPLDQMIRRQEKPRMLLTMPYGKHKGETITQLPRSYRNWFLHTQVITDRDLAYTLNQLKAL